MKVLVYSVTFAMLFATSCGPQNSSSDTQEEDPKSFTATSITDCPFDTANFFGVWIKDLDGPVADFRWTAKWFILQDTDPEVDGDPRLIYEVKGDSLFVDYGGGYITRKKFDASNKNVLIIGPTTYVRMPYYN